MILSIDVENSTLYAVEGGYGNGSVNIVKAGEAALPPSTVDDGIILNQASFISSVNRLISVNKFTSRSVIFTLNSSTVVSRNLELPSVKPKELAQMVFNEMAQVVSETGDFVFEYSASNGSTQNSSRVWAYALHRGTVEDYYNSCRNAKLKPVALDIHPNSIGKLFLGSSINGTQIGKKSVLFAEMKEHEIEIHLLSDGERAFSRVSPVSCSELKAVLSGAGYGSDENILRTLDFGSDEIRNDGLLNEAAHQYTNRVAEEFQKMIQFQLRRNSSNPVTNVYIYGTVSVIGGLPESLGAALGLHVETVKNIDRLKTGAMKNVHFEMEKYMNAIGALIRL